MAAEKLRLLRSSFPLFSMGSNRLSVVDVYKYLGLIYDNRWTWQQQFASVLTRATRVSALITRICTSRDSTITARSIRSLVLGMLYPIITFAAPFFRLLSSSRIKLNALMARPFARVLRLPATTHRLSILIECAVPDIQTEWERITLSYVASVLRAGAKNPRTRRPAFRAITEVQKELANRANGVVGSHAWTVPAYSLVPTVSRIRIDWSTSLAAADSSFGTDTIKSPNPITRYNNRHIRRFAVAVQLHRWNADPDTCRDLHIMRAITPSRPLRPYLDPPGRKPPMYLLLDDRSTAALRARLRFNRSSLPSSQFRRQMISSPACDPIKCGADIADVPHLLFCPLYRSVRASLSELYYTQPTSDQKHGRRDCGRACYAELIPISPPSSSASSSYSSSPSSSSSRSRSSSSSPLSSSSLDAAHVLQGELRSLRPQSRQMWIASLNITGEYLRRIDREFNAL